MTRITLQRGAPYAEQSYDLDYDANGNLVRKARSDGGETTVYTWDGRDRLVRIERSGDTPQVAEFGYDPLGRRSTRTVNGLTTRYLYDGPQALAELTDGQPPVALLTGLQIDEAIARYSDAGERAQLTEALGSVLALAGEDQTPTAFYVYSPYGETRASGDPDGNATQYTGRENDQTGLYYYRARYYDPVLKRFISEDPIGLAGGLNGYAYVEGNPLSYIDSDGFARKGRGSPGRGRTGRSGRGPIPPPPPSCPPDDDNPCEKQLEREEFLCEAIAGARYFGDSRSAMAICKKAAFARYSECLRGTPPSQWPPLTGVDTPI